MTRQAHAHSTPPHVFIVVVNWNGLADTRDCLDGLAALEYPNTTVVVVDNGSSDGSPDRIRADYPGVVLIRNATNLGYTGGNNVGLRHALAHGADYIWLLNNDAIPDPRCLSLLVRCAEERPGTGLISPVIYFRDEPHIIQFAGIRLDEATEGEAYIRSLRAEAAAGIPGVPMLVGTALLIKARVVTKIGLLDDRYFAYSEDWDYSLRALRAGFHLLLEPAAAVFHKGSQSLGGEDSPIREYYMVRNRYIFWRTHLSGRSRRLYPLRYLAWILERGLSARASEKETLIAAGLDGAWDALRGRSGPGESHGRMPRPLKYLVARVLLVWHPYLWIMLLRGQFWAVSQQTLRRALGAFR